MWAFSTPQWMRRTRAKNSIAPPGSRSRQLLFANWNPIGYFSKSLVSAGMGQSVWISLDFHIFHFGCLASEQDRLPNLSDETRHSDIVLGLVPANPSSRWWCTTLTSCQCLRFLALEVAQATCGSWSTEVCFIMMLAGCFMFLCDPQIFQMRVFNGPTHLLCNISTKSRKASKTRSSRIVALTNAAITGVFSTCLRTGKAHL